MSKIIAFSGKARSGKTTAAETIREFSPEGECLIVSFASPLKSMAMSHFGLTREQLINGKDEVIRLSDGRSLTVRQLLIELGRAYRSIDKNFWVSKAWQMANKHLLSGGTVLIDDMRYRSEAEFLLERGATLVRVERPGVKLIDDPSETELDDWNFEHRINNSNDINDYRQIVILLKNRIGKTEAPLP